MQDVKTHKKKKVKDLKRTRRSGVQEEKRLKVVAEGMKSNKRRWSSPPWLTVRVDSSPHWGRRRAPGTLDHYWRGRRAPTHGRRPVWITCYDQTNRLPKEDKGLTHHYNMQRRRPRSSFFSKLCRMTTTGTMCSLLTLARTWRLSGVRSEERSAALIKLGGQNSQPVKVKSFG